MPQRDFARPFAEEYTFVGNDPATLLDPSGEIAPLVALPFLVKALIGIAAAGIAAELTESPFVANFSLGHQVAQFIGGREVFTGRDLSGGERALSGLSVALAPLSIARGVLGAGGKVAFGVTAAHRAASATEAALGVNELFGGGAEEADEEGEFDNCFLAGTLVDTTTRGRVPVEDVRVDDRIAPPPGHEGCTDAHCGEVVRLFRNQTDQVVTITAVARPRAREHRAAARDGGEAGEEDGEPPSASQTTRCTPGHPFFVDGRGWVLAGDLRAGDALEARGERVVVAAVEVRAERAQTFNFEVACHHTYRVSAEAGEPAVLVHNMSLPKLARFRQATNFILGQRRFIWRFGDRLRELGHQGLNMVEMKRLGHLRSVELSHYKRAFSGLVNRVIKSGGRLKFDLTDLLPKAQFPGWSTTRWELEKILGKAQWLEKTDFFRNGERLTGEALENALRPFR